jgi:hypothetical protein
MLVDTVEVVSSETGEDDATPQQVEDRHQDLVGDGHSRLLCRHPRLEPVELVAPTRQTLPQTSHAKQSRQAAQVIPLERSLL